MGIGHGQSECLFFLPIVREVLSWLPNFFSNWLLSLNGSFFMHTWYLSPPPVMNFSRVGALFCTENAKFVVCFRRKGGQKYILYTCWVGDEDDEMSYIYIQ